MKTRYIFLRLSLFLISSYLFFMTSFLFIFINDKVFGFMYSFNLYLLFALLPTILARHFLMKYFSSFEIYEDDSIYKKLEILLNKTSVGFSVTTMLLMSITLIANLFMSFDPAIYTQRVSFFNQYGLMIGLIVTSFVLYISKKIKPYVILM